MHLETAQSTRYRLITAAQQIVHQHSSPERQRRQREQGFTLIEMIIVLAVIGILAAIAIPQFTGILSGAQATAIAGELSSASASNVAVCRQRGDDHPRCIDTSELHGENTSEFAEGGVDPTGPSGADEIWGVLYAIHINGADLVEDETNGDVINVGDNLPDWTNNDGSFDIDLTIGCTDGSDIPKWGNMECAIAEGKEYNGHWPWSEDNENGLDLSDIIETFQISNTGDI